MSLPTQLTFEQASACAETNKDFFRKDTEVDGFKVSLFNYVLPSYSSFIDKERGIDMFEMRGLTFVHEEKDGIIHHHRHLMLYCLTLLIYLIKCKIK